MNSYVSLSGDCITDIRLLLKVLTSLTMGMGSLRLHVQEHSLAMNMVVRAALTRHCDNSYQPTNPLEIDGILKNIMPEKFDGENSLRSATLCKRDESASLET